MMYFTHVRQGYLTYNFLHIPFIITQHLRCVQHSNVHVSSTALSDKKWPGEQDSTFQVAFGNQNFFVLFVLIFVLGNDLIDTHTHIYIVQCNITVDITSHHSSKSPDLGWGLLDQFPVQSFSQFFRIISRLVTCTISHSYLTGVTAAKLQRHPANMNEIRRI